MISISDLNWRKYGKLRIAWALVCCLLGIAVVASSMAHRASMHVLMGLLYIVTGLVALPRWGRHFAVPVALMVFGIQSIIGYQGLHPDATTSLGQLGEIYLIGPGLITIGLICLVTELIAWRRESTSGPAPTDYRPSTKD